MHLDPFLVSYVAQPIVNRRLDIDRHLMATLLDTGRRFLRRLDARLQGDDRLRLARLCRGRDLPFAPPSKKNPHSGQKSASVWIFSREISTDLVVQTMLGTAKLLRDEKMHPVELREMVTSPGGTTIAAIRELEQAGVRAAFLNAIQAAMKRSQELAEGG